MRKWKNIEVSRQSRYCSKQLFAFPCSSFFVFLFYTVFLVSNATVPALVVFTTNACPFALSFHSTFCSLTFLPKLPTFYELMKTCRIDVLLSRAWDTGTPFFAKCNWKDLFHTNTFLSGNICCCPTAKHIVWTTLFLPTTQYGVSYFTKDVIQQIRTNQT